MTDEIPKAAMSMKGRCGKCGSKQLMPDVQVIGDDRDGDNDIQVALYEDPDAFIFKGKRPGTLRAQVCGQCGFTELFVKNPRELWSVYRQSR